MNAKTLRYFGSEAKSKANAMYNRGRSSYLEGDFNFARRYAALLKYLGIPNYFYATGKGWSRNKNLPKNLNMIGHYSRQSKARNTIKKKLRAGTPLEPFETFMHGYESRTQLLHNNPSELEASIKTIMTQLTDADLREIFNIPAPAPAPVAAPKTSFAQLQHFTNNDIKNLRAGLEEDEELAALPASNSNNSGYSSNESTGFVPSPPPTGPEPGSPAYYAQFAPKGGKRTRRNRKNLKKRSHRRNNRKNGRTSRRN